MRKIDISEEDLRNYYLVKKIKAKEIAEIYGCSECTINTKIREYGIRRRKREKKIKEVLPEIINDEVQGPIDCNTQGKRCIYRTSSNMAHHYLCDYCCIVGKTRGGDPKQCTKYKFQRRRRK